MSTRPDTLLDARLPFFSGGLPRILAHRGLAREADENTIAAFAAALATGAQIIETDVRATADGVAVLFHDEVMASGAAVKDLTFTELHAVRLPKGGTVPTLSEALTHFPEAKFNIDFKVAEAIVPAARAIAEASAIDRVLVASFSRVRQRRATGLLPGAATSASALTVLRAVVAGKIRWTAMMRWTLRGVDAVQIPMRVLGMQATTRAMVKRFHAAGVEVHVWTINEESDMIALHGAGVDGIVTDRSDVAHRVFAL